MKTPEQLAAEIGAKITKQDGYPLMPSEYAVIIKNIQLDAFRAGMEHAAKQLDDVYLTDGLIALDESKQAILTAAKNLKEIPNNLPMEDK